MIYDLFYVSPRDVDQDNWKRFKERFSTARLLENVSSFDQIKSKAFTKLFWVVWDDLNIEDTFLFDYRVPVWDQQYIHVFLNNTTYDGIVLFPKSANVSQREFDCRFYTNNKKIDILASRPKPYSKYTISTYDQYVDIVQISSRSMIWIVWDNIEIIDNTVFDLYFDHHDLYNRLENHVFKNLCNDTASYYNGLMLLSTSKKISKREFDIRYLIDKKEHDIVASRYQYSKYTFASYEDYLNILETETQPLFWLVWDNIEIFDDTIFNLYYDPRDGKYDADRLENHVFKNLCNDTASYYNGLMLLSTSKKISKREFDIRYLVDKKEHDIVASKYQYPKYTITSYEDYLNILETETQSMFWCIWPEVDIINSDVFDLYFDPRDGKYDADRLVNHVFKHRFRGQEVYTNGVTLFSKNKQITKKEFDYRHLIEKKERNMLVSKMQLYDIVFVSYNETTADENYKKLLARFPRSKRVHGVKGIHQAHIEAAKQVKTEMFWVVDADAIIEDFFNFDYEVSRYDLDVVHVWRSRNPINNLVYGYGGVKLLPRELTINMDTSKPDMTTSISSKFRAVKEVSNITAFNTDKFNTWKSAFRECVKLASRSIQGQRDDETLERLHVWKTVGQDTMFGEYSILGAKEGERYGLENKDNIELLRKINDFEWLSTIFEKHNE